MKFVWQDTLQFISCWKRSWLECLLPLMADLGRRREIADGWWGSLELVLDFCASSALISLITTTQPVCNIWGQRVTRAQWTRIRRCLQSLLNRAAPALQTVLLFRDSSRPCWHLDAALHFLSNGYNLKSLRVLCSSKTATTAKRAEIVTRPKPDIPDFGVREEFIFLSCCRTPTSSSVYSNQNYQ